MEFITFHCPHCKQPLKIPADKAGRKAKCNKCATSLTIPFESETVAIKEANPTPAARKPHDEDEDDGPAVYTFANEPAPPAPPPSSKKRRDDDDEDEDEDDEDRPARRPKRIYEDSDEDEDDEEEEEKKEVVQPRRRRRLKGLRKAPLFPEKWQRVRVGMVLVAVSVCFGVVGLVVIRGMVLAGQFAGPNYAQIADQVFPANIQPVAPGPNQPPDVDLAKFFVALIMGSTQVSTARLLMIVALALLVLQSLLAIVGYIFYIQVPPWFGTRGIAIALTVIGVVNLILLIVFRLLPATGVISYVLIPVYAPELPMLSSNAARLEPFHIVWMHIPMLELFFGMAILFLAGFEAVLGCAFIRAVGKSLRDDGTDNKGVGLMKLGMGTLFIYLFYQMSGLSGTSDVLVGVLRVLYWLATSFWLGFLAWYTTVLFQTRAVIAEKLKEG
jgi:hypothetical protein